MQQLHLVGLTTDLDSLIFSARKGAKSGGFTLPLDDRLLAAIADAVRRRIAEGEDLDAPAELFGGGGGPGGSGLPRRQSLLSPREIQDRLRAGRSLEAIAVEAGVGEEWVARFAAPVEAERAQVVGRARSLIFARPRRGGTSGEPLGMAVRWNLADKGVRLTNDEFDGCWSAYQITDHAWMVAFTFVSRKRTQVAEWEVDLTTGDLVGRNRLASELAYTEPGRRRRSLSSLQPMPMLGTKGGRRAGTSSPASAGGGSADESASSTSTSARNSARGATPAKRTARTAGTVVGRKATSAAKRAAPAKRSAPKSDRKAAPAPAKRGASTRKAAGATKRAGTRTSARPAPRTAAKKAAKKAATPARRRAGGRDVPPAATTVRPERPAPNELGQRRLQLVAGGARPNGSGRPMVGRPGVSSRPAPRPQPSAVRIDAPRSTETPAPAPAPAASPPPPPPAASPPPPPPPEAVLDREDAAAEDRRAERRRARAATRAAAPARSTTAPDVPEGDGRVVTIRANRATPPVGEGTGDVILPAERPPLRPAQPAALPHRRRFTRTGR